MAKTYFIRTNGSEDNGFRPVTAAYSYSQYKEIIDMLKENGKPYETWTDDTEIVRNNIEQGENYEY